MKSLIFLMSFLFLSASFAGPGDGPIVPWPTNVERQEIIAEDLHGTWVAYGDNTLWFVTIAMDAQDAKRVNIDIESNGLFTGKASGWMYSGKKLFWGTVQMDDRHASGVVVYRDSHGIKMRIYSRNLKKVQELQLFAAP